MTLRMVAILALILVPPVHSTAQEPAVGAEEQVHVVREGDTLAALAREYLGSTAAWERIFEANRDLITDPHRIHPGMELTIPGVIVGARETGVEVIRGAPEEAPLVEVRGVVLEGERAVVPDTAPLPENLAERRALLRARPFRAGPAPRPRMDRTVFHGGIQQAERPETRPGVIVSDPDDALAVSRSAFHSAAWISPSHEDREAIGRVVGFEGDDGRRVHRTTVQRYDRVLIELESSERVSVGDRLAAYRTVGVGEVDALGAVQAPTGTLEVVALEDGGVVARMVGGFDRFEVGHRIRRLRTFPLSPGVHAQTTDIQLHGTLLAFRDRKEIYLPGDQGFIDLGHRDGVSVGDEFVGVAGALDGWEGRQVARFQVIGLGEEYATVRILSSQSPPSVHPGLSVALHRKMP